MNLLRIVSLLVEEQHRCLLYQRLRVLPSNTFNDAGFMIAWALMLIGEAHEKPNVKIKLPASNI